ncbi:unnamed protein product [Fusarium graminearum]|nr:unnamed protein product [Fusarium graminearum]CAF3588091.1 unnamed protein product [Fusarium graminearum]CAG1979011.1 unnamed protein product [Fusarium graminearum]VTO90179.1 unnamed protein product [Fusarium graminearum]
MDGRERANGPESRKAVAPVKLIVNYTSNLNGSTPLLKDPVEFAHLRFYNALASNGDEGDATQVCWVLDQANETPQTRTSTSRESGSAHSGFWAGGSGPKLVDLSLKKAKRKIEPKGELSLVRWTTNPVNLHAGGKLGVWETEIREARNS